MRWCGDDGRRADPQPVRAGGSSSIDHMLLQVKDAGLREVFVFHAAGRDGSGGSSYIDHTILRDKDTDDDGVPDERIYYIHNWRNDVVALVTDTGEQVESIRYSAYGIPFGSPAGDAENDGDVNGSASTDDIDQIQTWISTSTYDIRGDLDLNGDVDTADKTAALNNAGTITGWKDLTSNDIGNDKGYAGYEFDNTIQRRWSTYYKQHYVFSSSLGQPLQRTTRTSGHNLLQGGRTPTKGYSGIAVPWSSSNPCWTQPGSELSQPDLIRYRCCQRNTPTVEDCKQCVAAGATYWIYMACVGQEPSPVVSPGPPPGSTPGLPIGDPLPPADPIDECKDAYNAMFDACLEAHPNDVVAQVSCIQEATQWLEACYDSVTNMPGSPSSQLGPGLSIASFGSSGLWEWGTGNGIGIPDSYSYPAQDIQNSCIERGLRSAVCQFWLCEDFYDPANPFGAGSDNPNAQPDGWSCSAYVPDQIP